MVYDCIIIGAGAAGLFCGATFPKKVNGLILEKTKRIGTKLLMSGNGQCNITHDGSIKDFISCYGKNGGRVRSCLYRYHNDHLRRFLKDHGIDTFAREDGKVFPVSMDAKEIRDTLHSLAEKRGFVILPESNVTAFSQTSEGWCVTTENQAFMAKNVVLAPGGCSYPRTGSDGTLLRIIEKDLALSTVVPKPALSPIKVMEYPYTELAGISFSQAEVTLLSQQKPQAVHAAGLLFTHKDFSGPAVMNISKYGAAGGQIRINYLYPKTYEEVFAELKAGMQVSRESIENYLASTLGLPKRFTKVLVQRAGNSPKALAKFLTADTFTITSIGSFHQAMATAGGISLSEINTKTMELKKHPGLFAIGEVLDIDGMTGGYNLQFAYASASAVSSFIADHI